MKRCGLLLLCCFYLTGCAQFHATKGWTYLDRHDPDNAIVEFQQAEQLPGALLGLSDAYLQKGDLQRAEESLDKALRRYPNDWAVVLEKGLHCLKITKDYTCAIHYFERCKALKPSGIAAQLDALIQEARQGNTM